VGERGCIRQRIIAIGAIGHTDAHGRPRAAGGAQPDVAGARAAAAEGPQVPFRAAAVDGGSARLVGSSVSGIVAAADGPVAPAMPTQPVRPTAGRHPTGLRRPAPARPTVPR
jgi:hypothetical protein